MFHYSSELLWNNPWLQTLCVTWLTHVFLHKNMDVLAWIQNLTRTHGWSWVLRTVVPSSWHCKTIVLRGKITDLVDGYNCKPMTVSTFSDRFHALWNHILQHVPHNDTIWEISENVLSPGGALYNNNNNNNNNNNCSSGVEANDRSFLFVSQPHMFQIGPEVYAQTSIHYDEETSHNRIGSSTSRNMHIEIKVLSYTVSLDNMQYYLDLMTENYLENIRRSREHTRFLYTLYKTEYDTHPRECWMEHPFQSNRTFDNLFFDGKDKLLQQINFFVDNKPWYDRMGIPYTLGVGLSGPPGTGKTSLIKCIANHLGRHVVSLSLKMVKTRVQLLQFFYESQYNAQNRPHSIGFDKKILVLEDIDCMGDLVKSRKNTTTTTNSSTASGDHASSNSAAADVEKLTKLLQQELPKSTVDSLMSKCTKQHEDGITLDDILNLWDGLCETPHRILILTSNHYDQLDPALVRPGRIDLTLNMGHVTAAVVKDMFTYLFEKPWPEDVTVPSSAASLLTPAHVINLFLQTGRDETAFLRALHVRKTTKKVL